MSIQLRGGICAGTREAAPSIGLFDPARGQQAHAGYRLRARTDRQARHLTALITEQLQSQHVARQFPRSHASDRSEEKPACLAQAAPAGCQRSHLKTSVPRAMPNIQISTHGRPLGFGFFGVSGGPGFRSAARFARCSSLYQSRSCNPTLHSLLSFSCVKMA